MIMRRESRERVKKREMKSKKGGGDGGGSCSRKQSGDAAMSMPLI